MTNHPGRTGIIDIGSNSIRLVIYDTTPEGGYKIIKECKYSARLSEKIKPDGRLEVTDLSAVVPVLQQFQDVCAAFGAERIRAGATAAIRNARNSEEIIAYLSEAASLKVEIVSGKDEAYFGFLGVINAFDINDGFVVDIGGGSTEITLFQDRNYKHSISFPFGAVNTNIMFGQDGNWDAERVRKLQTYVLGRLVECPWLNGEPGLPLIGLGGTIRSLGKLDQKRRSYTLQVSHGYTMPAETIDEFMQTLPALSYDKRKELEGLSKSRADIIVSGLIIFHTVFHYVGASRAVISGEGLREGMLHDLLRPQHPVRPSALDYSIGTQLRFHGVSSKEHLIRVYRLAEALYGELVGKAGTKEHKILLYAAIMLQHIGSSVNYFQSKRHTRYWLMNAPIRGLTHRQLVLAAQIASYSTKSRKQKLSAAHKDILLASDEEWIHKLGTLVQLCASFDGSETGIVRGVRAKLHGHTLDVELESSQPVLIGLEEIDNAAKAFKSAWGLKVKLLVPSTN
ncbi:Ppx/GppA family phosphatase [Paenibacillus sp. CN-4]|uniref:Ppx/GppA phosphatase family protein n=1 Tax=Paenibacillus nanchangensis TaxID=3348343 RepID=UPI00397E3049